MERPLMMAKCAICGAECQFGRGIYAGQHVRRYKMTVCGSCYRSNLEGWASGCEPAFEAHLQREGIALPKRNEKGWYPRD